MAEVAKMSALNQSKRHRAIVLLQVVLTQHLPPTLSKSKGLK